MGIVRQSLYTLFTPRIHISYGQQQRDDVLKNTTIKQLTLSRCRKRPALSTTSTYSTYMTKFKFANNMFHPTLHTVHIWVPAYII